MFSRSARNTGLMVLIGIVVVLNFVSTGSLPAKAVGPSETPDFKQLCQAVLKRALTLTESGCVQTGRNEACYGYTRVRSQLQKGLDSETNRFSTSGDILPIRKLATIHTDPLDTANGTWGMAVLKLQASLPDTNPGQNVTFILFGDTELTPDTNHTNAYYLSTTLGEMTCNEVPQNSLLVRAPGHVAVNFTINGVEINAASIVVVRSPPGGMQTRVLEGHVKVTSMGVTKSLLAGEELSVPMNADKTPAGPPSNPAPFQRETTIESSVNLLDRMDATSDQYQGPITLSGPIEAINPLIPSLTLYGQLVLLDNLTGWEDLQVGQWVNVEGQTLGFMIQAYSVTGRDGSVVVKPTVTKTKTPQFVGAPGPSNGSGGGSSGGGNSSGAGNSGGPTSPPPGSSSGGSGQDHPQGTNPPPPPDSAPPKPPHGHHSDHESDD